MLPLLGIVAELFPDIIKQLGAPLHEQSGSVQDQVLEAIKKATGLQNPETADPQTVKAEMQKPAANAQLEKDLQDIALEDLKERDRANEEAQRVEFERYRMDAEERERIRAEEFQRQLLDFQDRQVARSTQMQLAEEHSPLAWVAPILAFVLVGMIWYLLHAILSAREQVINRDVFNVVLGALVTAFTTVMAYYFGSSLGSSRKDDALHSGRLVTNPKMKEQDGGEPGRRRGVGADSFAVSHVRKEFRPGYRDETHAGSDWDLWPVPAKGARDHARSRARSGPFRDSGRWHPRQYRLGMRGI